VRHYFYILFLLAGLSACRPVYQTQPQPASGMKVQQTPAEKKIEKMILPYRDALQGKLQETVVVSTLPLEKGLPESGLSNLIADAVFWSAKEWAVTETGRPVPEICLLNMGGIRTSLPAGVITVSNIYELMPFENEIVLLQITASDMRELFTYVASKGGAPLAGLRMKIKEALPQEIFIAGVSYAFDREVWVATSDFLASGGDDMHFLTRPLKQFETKIKVRDAITEYLRRMHASGAKLTAEKDGRITK